MNSTVTNALCAAFMRSGFDRSQLQSRIVHIGCGAFHRAHQALVTSDMHRQQPADWGICAVSLMSGYPLIEALRAQQGLFAVAEKGAQSTELKVVGSLIDALHRKTDGIAAVLAKMAEPQVAIVSLTITEKGYCCDPSSGELALDNPLIAADLANPKQPQSAIGTLVQALRIRRERGLAPFTVLSCDNMQANGHVTRAVVLRYAEQLDAQLATWIEQKVSFPCTMVDRIVPAAMAETLQEIADLLGAPDPCAIACEPFLQWIIEDNFVAGRPDWDLVDGVSFVTDVLPYEEMKLRMLNGSHSFLAYLGYLGGYDHISDTMADPAYRQAALKMMLNTQAPTLNMPAGTDLAAYAQMLIERFSNPNLKHKTWQIAMDGSQKIPQRLGGSLLHHLNQGTDFSLIALGIAAWMRYVAGRDEQDQPIDVRDPLAAHLQEISAAHQGQSTLVADMLAIESIFPAQIGQHPKVLAQVTEAYQSLLDCGARASVAAWLQR